MEASQPGIGLKYTIIHLMGNNEQCIKSIFEPELVGQESDAASMKKIRSWVRQ